MEHRTPEEYRALIHGWRIRLRNNVKDISSTMFLSSLRDIAKVLDEMEKEVPDYIPKVATPKE